jgi:hypothetical protein
MLRRLWKSREGSEGALGKRGRLGRGSEGRARNDADTTLHLFPFASFTRGISGHYLNSPLRKKKHRHFLLLAGKSCSIPSS